MQKMLASLLAAGLLATPVQARDPQERTAAIQPGVFVGAKLRLSIGGREPARPVAALAIAPTLSRTSDSGMIRTSIGEGVALNFGPRSKPTLTLAGVRADNALGLRRGADIKADQKLGVSTGGWIAIGVSAAAVVAGGLYLAADHIADCDEGECD
jgi:hypothetical protein